MMMILMTGTFEFYIWEKHLTHFLCILPVLFHLIRADLPEPSPPTTRRFTTSSPAILLTHQNLPPGMNAFHKAEGARQAKVFKRLSVAPCWPLLCLCHCLISCVVIPVTHRPRATHTFMHKHKLKTRAAHLKKQGHICWKKSTRLLKLTHKVRST